MIKSLIDCYSLSDGMVSLRVKHPRRGRFTYLSIREDGEKKEVELSRVQVCQLAAALTEIADNTPLED